MKKFFAMLIALVMSLSICTLAIAEDDGVCIVGVLPDTVYNGAVALTQQHLAGHPLPPEAGDMEEYKNGFRAVKYDTLAALLFDLKNGRIDTFPTNIETAQYIVERNPDLTFRDDSYQQIAYSMVTKEENTELYDILNNAIIDMKNDGTMDMLIETQLIAYRESDPVPAEIPHIEGAKTYKVAVTGDIPPMDFAGVDGTPAGFNVALLSEISKRANVNIEIVVVESSAKGLALMTGRVDAYFWMASGRCELHPDFKVTEAAEGCKATEDYILLDTVTLFLK